MRFTARATPLAAWAAALACVWTTLVPAPARAAASSAVRPSAYHLFRLDEHGATSQAAVGDLVSAVRAEAQSPRAQLVVLVHGYNTSLTLGKRQYRQIARDLRTEAQAAGWEPIIVGVHWPSHPGSYAQWLPRMLGYRFVSGTGFPNALSNPYLDKVRLAEQAGRLGFRSLLLGLQAAYPRLPLHVFAHSLGCEVTARALAPDSWRWSAAALRIDQPERPLRLGMVMLAGADLDQDAFAPVERGNVAAALPQAELWWVTVPRKNSADAALELRRTAGRRDAVGNVGLELMVEQVERLVSRRGLVIDNEAVPITHDLPDYFTRERLRALAGALGYLRDPRSDAAKASVLRALDEIAAAGTEQLAALSPKGRSASERLYLRWRSGSRRTDLGPVRVLDAPEPEPGSKGH